MPSPTFTSMAASFFRLLVLATVLAFPAWAQDAPPPARPPQRIELLAGNYQTSYPILGAPELFYQVLHPGIQVGYERQFWQRGRRCWLGRARGGVFYHRFIQTAIPLAVEGVYQWRAGKAETSRLALEAGLGVGYLHSFVLTDTYRLTGDGVYEKAFPYGRPQATVSLTPGLSLGLGATQAYRLLLRYQIAFQLPYVSGFVPLLPYNVFQLGVSRSIGK